MRMLLIMAAAMLSLAGCTLSNQTQSALEKGCDAARTGYSAFTIASEGKLVPAKTAAKVDAAFKGVRVICDNQPKDVNQAVLTVTAAAVVFADAYRSIR